MHLTHESLNVHEQVQELRSEQEQEFLQYLHHQRRTNSKYFDITCKMKIDFITLSVYLNEKRGAKPDETKLWPMFTDIWCNRTAAPQYNIHKGCKYDRSAVYQYKFEGMEHQVIIAKCSWNWLKPYLVTVHDPTQQVLEYLDTYLRKMDRYHVKDIEFTYDFYSENTVMFARYLEEHAVVSWRGKGYHSEHDTFYGNNIRFAHGKGLRVYKKEVEDDHDEKVEVARLEMLYKRPILEKNGIHSISDFINMDSRIVNKYLSFRNFNFRNLIKRMRKENCDNDTINREIKNIQNGIKGGYLYEMNQCYKKYYKGYPSLTYLKKNIFWNHFLGQFRSWYSFLDGDDFRLSSHLMEDGV